MSYLREEAIDEERFPSLRRMRESYGFLPNFFRAQLTRPDLIESEGRLIDGILIDEGALTRRQKEYVFLLCSAANLSTYCVAAHCEIVKGLGITGPEAAQIVVDHTQADIPAADKALLNFAAKLNARPDQVERRDVEVLRTYGFDDQKILETVLCVGLARFANHVASGLGTIPDFDPADAEALLARSRREALHGTR